MVFESSMSEISPSFVTMNLNVEFFFCHERAREVNHVTKIDHSKDLKGIANNPEYNLE